MLSHDLDNGKDVTVDLSVREAKDSIALAAQPFRSFLIAKGDIEEPVVHFAIYLDHQSPRMACEIRDVATDRRLPAYVRVKLAKLTPQALL